MSRNKSICFYRDKSEMSYHKVKSAVCNICNWKGKSVLQCKQCNMKVGHPRAFTDKDKSKLVWAFKTLGEICLNFTVKDIMIESGLDTNTVK